MNVVQVPLRFIVKTRLMQSHCRQTIKKNVAKLADIRVALYHPENIATCLSRSRELHLTHGGNRRLH